MAETSTDVGLRAAARKRLGAGRGLIETALTSQHGDDRQRLNRFASWGELAAIAVASIDSNDFRHLEGV